MAAQSPGCARARARAAACCVSAARPVSTLCCMSPPHLEEKLAHARVKVRDAQHGCVADQGKDAVRERGRGRGGPQAGTHAGTRGAAARRSGCSAAARPWPRTSTLLVASRHSVRLPGSERRTCPPWRVEWRHAPWAHCCLASPCPASLWGSRPPRPPPEPQAAYFKVS